jgi:hypothetical protein
MSEGETQYFRANGEFISGNPELENVVNLQAASSEYQTATEFVSPTSELSVSTESERLGENELELELFLHELRDNEFETIAHEMLQELEANFEGYAHQHGLGGELESMANHPSFENTASSYFEASIGHMVPMIQHELDTFSNHILSHVPVNADYEMFRRAVDSYQPVHSEDFIRRLARRVARGVGGLVKRGLKVVGKVARTAINVGRWIISGPFRRAVAAFIRWVRNRIGGLLRRLVRRVIQRLPPITRPFILRAARSIGLAEYHTPSTEIEARLTEAETELETESLGEIEAIAGVTTNPELDLEAESSNAETELEEELETSHSGEDQVAELLREFDTEWFNFAESELSHIAQSESISQPLHEYSAPTQPEYSAPTQPEYSAPGQEYMHPEATHPEYSAPGQEYMHPEATHPE